MKRITYADKPWLKFYESLGMPTTAVYPEIPLHRFLDDNARDIPNATAIIYEERKMTFKKLKGESDKLAAALSHLGVGKGDIVVIHLPTSAQFAISIWAISKTGAIQLWISTLLREAEIVEQLNESSAETIITLETSLDLINAIKGETKLKNIIITSITDYTPHEVPKPNEIPGTYQFRDLIAKFPPAPPQVAIDPKMDCALLRFTGGATGKPKGVMSSHYNLSSCTWQALGPNSPLSPLLGIIKGNNIPLIQAILMFHLGGFVYIYGTALGATQILILDSRDYPAIVKAINKHRPLAGVFVPTQWMKIAANKELKFTPPLGVSGAAPLAPESVKEYEVERGSIVGDAYGQSEANCVITVNYSYLISKSLPGGMRTFRLLRPILTRVISPLLKPLPPGTGKLIGLSVSMLLPLLKPFVKRGARGKPSKAVKAGSCGIPIPDTDVKLIDTETGEEAPVGEPGELYYRGPQLMLGYWPTPGKGLTEDGYLPSGDIAVMDEDGFFKIVDRTKDMINVSGFKVYTELLDEALRKHPAVYAAGAIGIPDPDIGRVVKK